LKVVAKEIFSSTLRAIIGLPLRYYHTLIGAVTRIRFALLRLATPTFQ